MSDFLKSAVDKALQSEKGPLDLFLRFLLGLSLESNQTLLRGVLTQTGNRYYNKEELVKYIKQKIRENPSPEKTINLFHCLNELNDHSLVQEVQTYLNRGGSSGLSGAKLFSFDLRKFDRSEECLLRLLPVIKASRKDVLAFCGITEEGCASLISALESNPSHLRELNLNSNTPGELGVKLLSDLLEYPHCKLEKLQLSECSITGKGCAALVSSLRSNPSHLRELNLNNSRPGQSGVKLLSDLLEDPHCKLETLQLSKCSITERGCAALVSSLKSNPSHLRELNLNYNRPGKSGVKLLSDLLENPHCKLETLHYRKPVKGVKLLSDLLKDPHCKLETLQQYNCSITEEGCTALVSSLMSKPSHLRELNLNYSRPGKSGAKLLSDLLEDPQCKLETLQCGCIQAITNYRTTPPACDSDASLPDALNHFYARFETQNREAAKKTSRPPDDDVLFLTAADVKKTLRSVNPQKTCLKATNIIPVPKKSSVSCLNDYRPVALIVIKCFERLVMRHINTLLPPLLDPLQFCVLS
ncbi:hypothetical protein NFI96_000462 [Prochilodus magdalenae]|nr:hypothetical protein NFI96_000462 [Prochilodus magdalenae]